MSFPWRNPTQQAAYEAQLPDRFEDAGDWIALAERLETLVGGKMIPAAEYQREAGAVPATRLIGARTALGVRRELPARPAPVRGGDVFAPAIWEQRQEYEALRLRGKYASLAGIAAANDYRNTLALKIRSARDPVTLKGLQQSLYAIQQYLLEPDKRAPFSKLLRDLDIIDSRGRLLPP